MVFGNTIFSEHAKKIGIISTVIILAITYGLFFYQQNISEENVRNSLFIQQRDRQMEATKGMAGYITSDLSLILSNLQGLAGSSYLQQGELYGDRVEKLMKESFSQINNITKVDGLYITDLDDIITYNIVGKGQRSFVNIDISFRDYVQETRNSLKPVFSDGFEGIDGVYRIALSYPIINRENGQYIGLVGVEIPTIDFFARHGNVYDINSQYLSALDRHSVHLIHPVKSFIGTPFFGNYSQEITENNKILNNLVQTVMSGKPDSTIYEFKNDQRLTSGYPIFLGGAAKYFLFIITPTKDIYAQINSVLFTERLKMFSLVAGATAAIVILILFLIKWNSILEKRVKRRTSELEVSNNELEFANEQLKKINEDLKKHDELQKQFINMAAHELRTPSQAIIGFAELLSKSSKRNRDYEATLLRNANRLHKLSTDMLDAARIEAGTMKIDKSEFDLNEKIKNVITDVKQASEKAINDNHIQIIFQPKESIIVNADKAKIFQVISNLLNNAIKFSDHGTIVLTAHKNEETKNAVVIITDTGKGIDAKLLPDLFLRFRAKSETGTGLGLFISKKIIEAHGGEITGYNNPIGKGATFTFTLPLSNESE